MKFLKNHLLFIIVFFTIVSNSVCYAKTEIVSLNNDDEFNDEKPIYDPLEPFNRGVFKFNRYADKFVVRPITLGYRKTFPTVIRKVVSNFVRNLDEPITILNSAFQGDLKYSVRSLGRFMVNSTLGMGGTMRLVNDTNRKEDFGQTLGHYKVGPGAYIMLPILGPSDSRDTIGYVADTLSNPAKYLLNPNIRYGILATTGLSKRDELLDLTDEIEHTSLDIYATYRSLYLQRRAALIKNEDDL